MPARLAKTAGLGLKIVSVRPKNAERGQPTVPATVLLLDEATGLPAAIMQATYLTAIRTAAASGAATRLLAKSDAATLAVFGAGLQAKAHVEAMLSVRGQSLRQVYILNRTNERAQQLCDHFIRLKKETHPDIEWTAVDWQSEEQDRVVREADIIVAATNSSTPLFRGELLKEGAHINAIGSYMPSMQELDEETVKRAKVVADDRGAVLAEAGDVIVPIQRGLITEEHVLGALGAALAGDIQVRTSEKDITLFKSVGSASQDIAVAQAALKAAQSKGLGQRISNSK
ncbi:Ornithine cyclodeaminase [Balamuthia mandrillaris]